MSQNIAKGTVHALPKDMRKAFLSNNKALLAWETLTPLARNEWICWTISAKKTETRNEHLRRTITELKKGKRRPCCWMGCIHRTDKPISASVKHVISRKSKRNT